MMSMAIPSKNDKDAQIEYLKNTLASVKRQLEQRCCIHYYNDFEVVVRCIEAEDVDSIIDNKSRAKITPFRR